MSFDDAERERWRGSVTADMGAILKRLDDLEYRCKEIESTATIREIKSYERVSRVQKEVERDVQSAKDASDTRHRWAEVKLASIVAATGTAMILVQLWVSLRGGR